MPRTQEQFGNLAVLRDSVLSKVSPKNYNHGSWYTHDDAVCALEHAKRSGIWDEEFSDIRKADAADRIFGEGSYDNIFNAYAFARLHPSHVTLDMVRNRLTEIIGDGPTVRNRIRNWFASLRWV
jgi:hypothetical protein